MDLTNDLQAWYNATGMLPAGVQSLCLDTLKLAADEKVRLVHSTNVKDGVPCLFNAISNMTTQLGSTPSQYAPDVVILFDSINTKFEKINVNTEPNRVSPLAAFVLARNFGPIKPITLEDKSRLELERQSFMVNCSPYFEPTDEEIITDWLLNIEEQDANSRQPKSV